MDSAGRGETGPAGWTFLTNHAHVLLCIAREPNLLMRDVAERVGITERAVQRIVAELEADGYISHRREGRVNRYTVHPELPLRHPVERHCTIGDLMQMVAGAYPTRRARRMRS